MKILAAVVLPPVVMLIAFVVFLGSLHPGITVKYNGETIFFRNYQPNAYDGGKNLRIIVPIDLLAVKLGATASMDKSGKALTVSKGINTVVFQDGSINATVNGRPKALYVQPVFKDSHVFASVGFLAENLGKAVYWESKTSSMNIIDIQNELSEKKNISEEYVSVDSFSIKSDRIVLKKTGAGSSTVEQTIDEKLNPSINRQLTKLIQYLAGEGNFLYIHSRGEEKGKPAEPGSIRVAIAPSRSDAVYDRLVMSLDFYEKSPANPRKQWGQKKFSQNAFVKFDIYNARNKEGDSGSVFEPGSLYEYKFKLAMLALFGENTGLNIYEYMKGELVNINEEDRGETGDYFKTRRFDNIRVDMVYKGGQQADGSVHTYFSYQK